MDPSTYFTSVEAALEDADASLSMDLGGQQELTSARLWRGQVLVDWEPDAQAGGCLLRPALLRRLAALHASVTRVATRVDDAIVISATGRVVAALSAEHADLVRRLGGVRRVALRATLRFRHGAYVGGDETYYVVERGRAVPLVQLRAEVRIRSAPRASPRTSPAKT